MNILKRLNKYLGEGGFLKFFNTANVAQSGFTVLGDQDIYDIADLDAESLQDGAFGSFTNWTDANDFNEGTTAYDYLHSSGAGTLTQATADQTIAGVPSRWYKLVYTITSVTAVGALAGTITSAFALTAQALIVDVAGTYTLVFKSALVPGDFVISCTSDTALDGFTIDDLTLKEINGDINAGTATIGHFLINDNTISTTDTDGDINLNPNGSGNVITDATFKPTGDPSASDLAAVGYNSTDGLVLTGQGSTNDVTIKNDIGQTVIRIPTGGLDTNFTAAITAGAEIVSNNRFVLTSDASSDLAGTGLISVGAGTDAGMYWNGTNFVFDRKTGIVEWDLNGVAHADLGTAGLNIRDTSDLASESLQDGNFSSFTNWTDANDFDEGTNNYAYLHNTGAGTLTQAAADLTILAAADRWYQFSYTVSAITNVGANVCTLTSAFALTTLTMDVSTAQTVTHRFKSAVSPGDFVISATSDTASDGFTLDDVTLKEIKGYINTGVGTFGHLKLAGNTLSSVDTNGAVIIAPNGTGVVEIAKDLDVDVDIGRSTIGTLGSNFATFSHIDHNTSTSYGFLQDDGGETVVNAVSGKNVTLKVNNSPMMTVGLGVLRLKVSGITAGTTQTQAGATNLIDVISLVTNGNANDGVKLPTAIAASIHFIYNNSANILKVYPNTDDTINGGSANVEVDLAANKLGIYIALDAVNWGHNV